VKPDKLNRYKRKDNLLILIRSNLQIHSSLSNRMVKRGGVNSRNVDSYGQDLFDRMRKNNFRMIEWCRTTSYIKQRPYDLISLVRKNQDTAKYIKNKIYGENSRLKLTLIRPLIHTQISYLFVLKNYHKVLTEDAKKQKITMKNNACNKQLYHISKVYQLFLLLDDTALESPTFLARRLLDFNLNPKKKYFHMLRKGLEYLLNTASQQNNSFEVIKDLHVYIRHILIMNKSF
jgi:hypothetical protein